MSDERDRRGVRKTAPRRHSLRLALLSPVVIPAVALAGLGTYAATDSVDTGLQLKADAKTSTGAGNFVHALVTRLQDERRITAAYQNHRTNSRHKLLQARSRTDSARTTFRAAGSKLAETAHASTRARLTKALEDLGRQRNRIDAQAGTRRAAYSYYTNTIEAGTALLTDVLRSNDGTLARNASAVADVVTVGELLSREDALLTTARSSGHMAPGVRKSFLKRVSSQRQIGRILETRDLPKTAAKNYREIADKPQWTVLQRIENTVDSPQSSNTDTSTRLPEYAGEWRPAADVVTEDLRDTTSASLDGMAQQAADRADDDLLTAAAEAAAVAAVLLLTGALAVRNSRRLIRRLRRLQDQATQWTDTALPHLVDRHKRGEQGDTATESPEAGGEGDDVERLDAAICAQQLAAIEGLSAVAKEIDDRWQAAAQTSAQQTRKRDGAESVVLGLLRRNQLLIIQLISLIDGLERREHDPELLTDIFKIDHLVTRLRRDLENQSLIVGVQPSRRWSKPVPVFQVLRSAVAETLDYTRVQVEAAPELALTGRVVADIGHILAALIENGTSFSPPHTHVTVRAEEVAEGRLAVEVIDRGLGMESAQYDRLNQLLTDPPEPDVTQLGEIPQLGLFVVALLANRIGLDITLCRSAYGGTKAVVLIPSALLEESAPVLPNLTETSPKPSTDQLESACAESSAPSSEDDLGGYPAYLGGGLMTQPEPQPPVDASALAPLIPTTMEPDIPAYVAAAQAHEQPEEPPAPAPPAPAPSAPAPPTSAEEPETLPTRKPGENLAAPLRRSLEQPSSTREEPPGTEDSPPPSSVPKRAGAIAGAVQQAHRQARTEPSEAQRNGASAEDATN